MAFALMTMLLMTSCLGGSNGTRLDNISIIALYQEDGTILQDDGRILVPTNSQFLIGTTPGMYTFTIECDPNAWENDRLAVTIKSIPVSIENRLVVSSTSTQGNINLYDLNYEDGTGKVIICPGMFNKDYLIVPVIYWCENSANADAADKELAKHNFALTYSSLESKDGVLELYLVDTVSETTTSRVKMTRAYQAFNLRNVISNFKYTNGSLPKTIRVNAYVNDESNKIDDGRTKLEFTDIDYTKTKQ